MQAGLEIRISSLQKGGISGLKTNPKENCLARLEARLAIRADQNWKLIFS